jgi:(p)ppGpp synthase/HD superfamily hydrolase
MSLGSAADAGEAEAMTRLGPRFDAALVLSTELHRAQQRKSTEIPYVSHVLGVASLVLEDGGSEDEAIAALLHDAVEDQGGAPTLELIRQRFGDAVAEIVAGCSDTDQQPKPPWRARKEAYLAHLEDADEAVLRVSLGDKLHNARAIARDLRTHGDSVWTRFNSGRDEQLWYYHSLLEVFRHRSKSPMVDELEAVIQQLG